MTIRGTLMTVWAAALACVLVGCGGSTGKSPAAPLMIMMPSVPLPTAAVPPVLVPMKLPSIRLAVALPPSMRIPSTAFPEMTLAAAAVVPARRHR